MYTLDGYLHQLFHSPTFWSIMSDAEFKVILDPKDPIKNFNSQPLWKLTPTKNSHLSNIARSMAFLISPNISHLLHWILLIYLSQTLGTNKAKNWAPSLLTLFLSTQISSQGFEAIYRLTSIYLQSWLRYPHSCILLSILSG